MLLMHRAGAALLGWSRPSALVSRSQFDLLRFVAGMRALLALLAGIALVTTGGVWSSPFMAMLLLPYLALAAALLPRTLAGWPFAASAIWLWIDALVITVMCRLLGQDAPWVGITSVVPVVALSLLAGPVHAVVMALAIAASMLVLTDWHAASGGWPSLASTAPMLVLALGPAAAFLTVPNRALRQKLELLDEFHTRSDPRQGLLHHVELLLQLLDRHFHLSSAVIGLQGLEPRIFQRDRAAPTRLLDDEAAGKWRERRSALPDAMGCLCTRDGVAVVPLEPFASASEGGLDAAARDVMLEIGPETLALPLKSYGKPLGHLCLTRREVPFTVADLQWLNDVMRELLPLLERSDLLEQLQRETAAAERERIGRDLHDSAVQPYLGLKYGLEALARQAGPDNVIARNVDELIQMTTQELQTLREVVSGLRNGEDDLGSTAFMGALHRQAHRFESLYGLKVNIFAPDALQLRGSVAKAVLHMVNEGLTNVRRHTPATAVTVMLDVGANKVAVRLRNDHGPAGARPEDFVPRSLSERASELGGAVSVSHEPNYTEVAIALPILGALG